MILNLEMPDSFFISQDKPALVDEIRLSYALFLFRQSRISLTRAAHMANKNIYVFMEECKKNRIPVIDYSNEEFQKELEVINKLV
jgi:predicted HTH domain antitoxin